MKTNFVSLGTAFLLAGSSAWAHHSFASEFDVNKPLTLRGKVVKVEWLNPHASIQLAVTDQSGRTSDWTIECGSPNTLLRGGFTKESLPKGAEILVAGWRAKDNSLRANGSTVTLPGGSKLSLGSSHENDRQQDVRESRTVGVPTPYPVYVTSAFNDSPPPPAPVAAPYYPTLSQELLPSPPAITINQFFGPDPANPVITDDTNTPPPQAVKHDEPKARSADNQPIMFLIAMTDHTIIPAVAYWVDGDTFNYINLEGSKNSASIGLVDREFSKQLNKERKIDFGLPGDK